MTEVRKQTAQRLFEIFLVELGEYVKEDATGAKDFGNARANDIKRLTGSDTK